MEVGKHDEGRSGAGHAALYRIADGERFVLLYTRGRLVGQPTPMAELGPNVPQSFFSAKTTAEGQIEAETGPITNK